MIARWRWELASVLLASACASTAVVNPPLAGLASDHFVGTLQSGALAQAGTEEGSAPEWFEVRLAYLEAQPPGEPVSAFVRQVFTEGKTESLQPRSSLAPGIVCTKASKTSEPRTAQMPELVRQTPAWPGTVACWRTTIDPTRKADDPPHASWDSFEIQLEPAAGGVGAPAIALVLGEQTGIREHLVLDPLPTLDASTLRLFLPAPRMRSPVGGFQIEVRRIADPPDADASLEDARAKLAASCERARADSESLTSAEGQVFESVNAVGALENRRLRRAALAFLSQSTGAQVAGELAIGCTEEELGAYLACLRARSGDKKLQECAPEELGWSLESSAFAFLIARSADEAHPIEPELEAMFLVHAGELARFPDLVHEALDESDGQAAFRQRLIDENTSFLEDADPAARLRAFEWLRSSASVPDGFDPLGSLRDRRAALDRARATESADVQGGAR
jgi:hypothetical protein